MSVDPVEIVKTFFKLRDEQGIMAVAEMLSDGYQRFIPGLDPLDKQTYLAAMVNAEKALAQKHKLSDFVVDGNVVRFKETTSGAFVGPMDMTPIGLGVIQPNGKSFTLPDIIIELTVVEGKITRQQDPPPPPGKAGYELLLDALGIKLPEGRDG
jgi:hypothetical protein